jgi:hypothetical protein
MKIVFIFNHISMGTIEAESYLALMASEGVQKVSYKELRELRTTFEGNFPHIYIEITKNELLRAIKSLPIFTMEDTKIVIHPDRVRAYRERIQDRLIPISNLPQQEQTTMRQLITAMKSKAA